MKTAEKISQQIASMPDGNTFTYESLPIERNEYAAATKAMERLIKSGVISRAAAGLFYKPKKTVFGNLMPEEQDLLKPYLFAGGKRVAYITGNLLYNQMGLTTQVPKNVKVASRDRRLETSIGRMKVTSVKSKVDISEENYRYLEILDALKDLKTIPDVNINSALKLLKARITELGDNELLGKLALTYPPRVRALTGALMELIGERKATEFLKQSLNPLSRYQIGLNEDHLPTLKNWNID